MPKFADPERKPDNKNAPPDHKSHIEMPQFAEKKGLGADSVDLDVERDDEGENDGGVNTWSLMSGVIASACIVAVLLFGKMGVSVLI